jgi:hypothetical protein
MAITLLGHQPIDFTYKENDPCENLSDMCLQYETGDNPMFQIKNSGISGPLVVLKGYGTTEFDEVSLTPSITGEFYTYTINFATLGITEGCYEVCIYDAGTSGTNLVTNGTFLSDLTGWTVADALILDVDTYTSTSVTLSASGGTAPYTYSNGCSTYQASATFSGLVAGTTYTFCVKDANGAIDTISYTLRDCAGFAGSEAFDIKDIEAVEIKDCEAADFV